MKRAPTIAVTGLNATDNPAPGVAVIRSLRQEFGPDAKLVGLAYDGLDPGLYSEELGLHAAYLLPWPSQGVDALRARIAHIHAQSPLDVLLPTLDSELPSMIALAPELQAQGIGTFLPTKEQFELRSKANLEGLGRRADVSVPKSKAISSVDELLKIHEEVPYPLMVKGVFYGAELARNLDEALAIFHRTVAKWGLPVIVQQFHAGEEYDVVAVGDGRGGLVGAVPMKKLMLTDKGKGWAGVAVRDEALLEMTAKFMAHTKWRGPCEVEVLRTHDEQYFLIEVNPRFPAWCHLAAGAGQNLPAAVARLAAGEPVEPMRSYRAGTMFVRISLDQITTLARFEALATHGEWKPEGDDHVAAPV